MGMTPRLIIVSSFPVVFPDYGMIDTNILGGAFRFSQPIKGEKRGTYLME